MQQERNISKEAEELIEKVKELLKVKTKSEDALRIIDTEGIGHMRIIAYQFEGDLSLEDCALDECQNGAVKLMLTSVISTRLEQTSKELTEILDKVNGQTEEPLPTMEPDTYVLKRERR